MAVGSEKYSISGKTHLCDIQSINEAHTRTLCGRALETKYGTYGYHRWSGKYPHTYDLPQPEICSNCLKKSKQVHIVPAVTIRSQKGQSIKKFDTLGPRKSQTPEYKACPVEVMISDEYYKPQRYEQHVDFAVHIENALIYIVVYRNGSYEKMANVDTALAMLQAQLATGTENSERARNLLSAYKNFTGPSVYTTSMELQMAASEK